MTSSVLQVVTSAERRGAETFALELAAGLARRRATIRTVALTAGENPALDVPHLGARPLSRTTLQRLRAEAHGVDVVIAHGSTTLPACAVALLGARVPFVYRNIGDPTFWASTLRRRARVAAAMARATAVVALTAAAGDAMHRLYGTPRRRITVIPTGISSAQHVPAPSQARAAARSTLGLADAVQVATVVGALSPEKGVDVAIDAVAEIPGLHLLVAGDGPERSSLEGRAERRAPGRIKFLGAMRDPGEAYAAADVFVLPSRTEGLPAVLIEAGLHGLPAVATDVGYVRDIVVDGHTGVVVPPDAPSALAAGLRAALALGPSAGVAARARCEARYELEHVVDQWADLIARTSRHHG